MSKYTDPKSPTCVLSSFPPAGDELQKPAALPRPPAQGAPPGPRVTRVRPQSQMHSVLEPRVPPTAPAAHILGMPRTEALTALVSGGLGSGPESVTESQAKSPAQAGA